LDVSQIAGDIPKLEEVGGAATLLRGDCHGHCFDDTPNGFCFEDHSTCQPNGQQSEHTIICQMTRACQVALTILVRLYMYFVCMHGLYTSRCPAIITNLQLVGGGQRYAI